MRIYNEDCIAGARAHLADETADLLVCDPPFGIHETDFDKHYKRNQKFVLKGYREAPERYLPFSVDWLSEAKRVMKPHGSMYLFSGWSKLRDVLNALDTVGLEVINHLIWKYNFGVYTTRKFVTSHYHVLYVKKPKGKPKFNTTCRFGRQERRDGRSLLYRDLEDVFAVDKDYMPAEKKNENKLPDELVRKLILYSSCEGDVVADFFLGNFTTAFVARRLGREPVGFEMNKQAFQYYLPKLEKIVPGCELASLKKVVDERPANQGKPLSDLERANICVQFASLMGSGKSKKDAIAEVGRQFGRGRFAILNIIQRHMTVESAYEPSH